MKTAKTPRFPYKRLVLGILLIVSGCLLLLMSLGYLYTLRHLWPLPLIIIGLIFLFRCVSDGIKGFYLIGGIFLTLLGIFFLLINTVFPPGSLKMIWPTFMFITGVSILPFGIYSKRPRRTKLALIIPAVAIICLSLLFLPFSLGLIQGSFISFALKWWPLLVIVSGLILVVSYFSYHPTTKDNTTSSKKTS